MFDIFRKNPDALASAITGKQAGATLFVTAGMDGDEYAGIAAAFEVAEHYTDGNFSGRLIIVPIVNMAGFEAGCAENPTDHKYPKYCIPGRAWGSASERLVNHLVKTYAQHAHMWLDLHSGGRNELAIPCIWNDITGVAPVDARGEAFGNASGATAVVREQARRRSRSLATRGCTYALAESEDPSQHVSYVQVAMQTLEMVPKTIQHTPPRVFTATRELRAAIDGPWDPQEYESTMPPTELLLWHRLAGSMRKGDRLGEIAHSEQKS
jgi:hypothetical protein